MDEEARKIFEESYRLIDRINNMEMRPAVPNGTPVVETKKFTPVTRRTRGLDTMPQQEPDWDAWNNWCDKRIADFLNQVFTTTLVPMVCGRINKAKQAAADELNQLKTEIAELRGEVNLLCELLKGNVKDITHARKDIA
jgi:hypothetical protein